MSEIKVYFSDEIEEVLLKVREADADLFEDIVTRYIDDLLHVKPMGSA